MAQNGREQALRRSGPHRTDTGVRAPAGGTAEEADHQPDRLPRCGRAIRSEVVIEAEVDARRQLSGRLVRPGSGAVLYAVQRFGTPRVGEARVEGHLAVLLAALLTRVAGVPRA